MPQDSTTMWKAQRVQKVAAVAALYSGFRKTSCDDLMIFIGLVFTGIFSGQPHISWENRWFSVDFPRKPIHF